MKEITKKKPFEGSKHPSMQLVMQLVITPLWPYDFKGAVEEKERFRTIVQQQNICKLASIFY